MNRFVGLYEIDILGVSTGTCHHHVILSVLFRSEEVIVPVAGIPEFIIPGAEMDLADLFLTVEYGVDLKSFRHHGIDLLQVQGQGIGGQISVDCEVKRYGKLVVQENMYSGWKAWMDGEQASLSGEHWLEVNAPKGSHTFEFRYQPWDVLLGLVLCLIGTIACLIIWYPGKRNR